MSTANPRLLSTVIFVCLLFGWGLIRNWLTPPTPTQRIAVVSGLEKDDAKSNNFLGNAASICQTSETVLADQIIKSTEFVNKNGFSKTPFDILYDLGTTLTAFLHM